MYVANLSRRAKSYSVTASDKMCEAYKAYFSMPVRNQDKRWTPHFTCEHCRKALEGYGTEGKREHYNRKHWPQRTETSVGRHNVKCEPLVDLQKMLYPPLHINLGLIKQFVTALDKESAAFKYLRDFFPKLSEAKVKAGVFVGPQIKKILECTEFPKMLSRKEEKSLG
ncbi:uncharacterized protein LOC143244568 [Tachypleus tridentatus]|uniref:uncharacterized protein LOC143244568 n=1 Tax=Tachypleus tridentatus TaxID=6853 RepID=UPI003FD5F623